jgi:spore coat protein U-like protein
MRANNRVRALGIALMLLGTAVQPAAADCAIGATAVAFGSYDVFTTAPLDSTGSVSYQCSIVVAPVTITISLDRGGAPSFNPRQMRRGTQALKYNLYLDPARLVIWGDGTGGSQAFTTLVSLPSTVVVPVYARIPARQDVAVGTYSDTVTVTILF